MNADRDSALTGAAIVAAIFASAFVCRQAHSTDLREVLSQNLKPDIVLVELEHTSHATQHEPLTSQPTNYGYNAALITARWDVHNVHISISEGSSLDRCYRLNGERECGALYGPREVFTIRVGYTLWSKQ